MYPFKFYEGRFLDTLQAVDGEETYVYANINIEEDFDAKLEVKT